MQFRERSLEWKHSALAHSTGEARTLRAGLEGELRQERWWLMSLPHALFSAGTLEANHDSVIRGGVPMQKRYRVENFRVPERKPPHLL